MAESLCCLPEIITTLLISYIPVRNKSSLKKKKKEERKPWALLWIQTPRPHPRFFKTEFYLWGPSNSPKWTLSFNGTPRWFCWTLKFENCSHRGSSCLFLHIVSQKLWKRQGICVQHHAWQAWWEPVAWIMNLLLSEKSLQASKACAGC